MNWIWIILASVGVVSLTGLAGLLLYRRRRRHGGNIFEITYFLYALRLVEFCDLLNHINLSREVPI
jgi:LPXTG-motif cell wall-anchored protein